MQERQNSAASPDRIDPHPALLDCIDALCELGRAWHTLKARQQHNSPVPDKAVGADDVEDASSNSPEAVKQDLKTGS